MNERELLKQQLITTGIFFITLMVSMSLSYDELLKLDKKKLFCDDTAHKVSILNRAIVLLLSFSFLYINFKNKEIARSKGQKTDMFNLQIAATELTTIAAIIVLYVVIKSGEYTITAFENPTL